MLAVLPDRLRPRLLTRWLQLAAFQPIDRDHAAKGTRDYVPWVDGPEHEAIRRHFIEERYRLMPYLYHGGGDLAYGASYHASALS